MDDELRDAKERSWREVEAIDAAHARGDIDDAGWHRAMAALVVPAYLAAATPQGGSGHTGSADDWEWSRGVVAEALDRDGTFLDVGCANGLLMESVARWATERGLSVEAYGLDISPELADFARRRLPGWDHRIVAGNALGFAPVRRFDVVRTGLEYVPAMRRRELVSWLLDEVVAPGGRLVIGKYNEEIDDRTAEHRLARWGFHVTGRAERRHRTEPRLAYRVTWVDVPLPTGGDLRFRALRRDDLPLLARWLAEPHVAIWWREAHDLERVRAKYEPRIDGRTPTHVFVMVEAGAPVGWIQWYRWSDYADHAARIGAARSEAGVDLAIGEPDRIGRGLGSRALRAFVEDVVFADDGITGCLADPEEANTRSVRAFERAGFVVERVTVLQGESSPRCIVRRQRPPTCISNPSNHGHAAGAARSRPSERRPVEETRPWQSAEATSR
jgi:RimJ/RimL family protein N-acetyltransferase/2-polyprenyl-3-methyl-5-hydroxy-6-metoxy-1,4-benzoquinol methylase